MSIIYIASDHGGFNLKTFLVQYLKDKGHDVHDLGPSDPASCDYPLKAQAVTDALLKDENALGALVGPALAIPTAVMSFAMTAIFICLLAGQRWTRVTAVVAATAFVVVVALKLVGAGSLSVLLGAVAGVVAGLVAGAAGRDGGGAR